MMWLAFTAGMGAGAALACLVIGIAGLLRGDRQVRPGHLEDLTAKETRDHED